MVGGTLELRRSSFPETQCHHFIRGTVYFRLSFSGLYQYFQIIKLVWTPYGNTGVKTQNPSLVFIKSTFYSL